MELQGIHHITAITADAQANLSFYAGTLGLRFVKKTVNFDDPETYHLYYGDDRGTPGSDPHVLRLPRRAARHRRRGHDPSHRLARGRASPPSTSGSAGWKRPVRAPSTRAAACASTTPRALPSSSSCRTRRRRRSPRPWRTYRRVTRLRGFAGVRAYSGAPQTSAATLEQTLGFAPGATAWVAAGGGRSSSYVYDAAPRTWAYQGAGTVHHIAWAVPDADQPAWRERLLAAGLHATPIIDRTYFHSVYFREPSGVLFEIATLGPGFAVDESFDRLGEVLRLPAPVRAPASTPRA